MSKDKSSFPVESNPLLFKCGKCLEKITLVFCGEKTPIHDPITGDVICSDCNEKPHTTISPPESSKWLGSQHATFPLWLSAGGTRIGGISTMYDKCTHHACSNTWSMVDLDGLNCLCLSCSKHDDYQHTHQLSLEGATLMIRERLATGLTTLSHNVSQVESKGNSDDQTQGKMKVIEAAQRMSAAAKALLAWLLHVETSKKLVCDKISQLKSVVMEGRERGDNSHEDDPQEDDSRQPLQILVGDLDRRFENACHMHINSVHSLVCKRQAISGTLLNGISLLGHAANTITPLTKDVTLEALRKRDVSPASIGEEVFVLRSLESLSHTLKQSNSSLLELTEVEVEQILNRPGGLSDVLGTLSSKLKSVSYAGVVTEVEMASLLNEAKEVVDKVVMAISLLYQACIPEYWVDNISEREDDAAHQEEVALQACLDVLLYVDAASRPLTHNSLKRLNDAMMKLSEANRLFIEGVRAFIRGGSPYKYLSQAEQEGCDHPILHYFLAECHKQGDKGVAKNSTKALVYYDKAIQGV